jgi:hypothetical protein
MFNGVLQELPNDMNLNWFYDNLNYSQRQKVFAFTNTRWGEIWWCFPYGNATECTHAVIYNIREKAWYDTELPETGRSCADSSVQYPRPMMGGVVSSSGNYKLWQHENGLDAIDGDSVQPIQSYFETNEISMMAAQQPTTGALRVNRIEPDFVQSGPLTVTVSGRANARADVDASLVSTFEDTATTPEEQTVNTGLVRRLMRFKFESNAVGGDYQMGSTYAHVGEGDGRITK